MPSTMLLKKVLQDGTVNRCSNYMVGTCLSLITL